MRNIKDEFLKYLNDFGPFEKRSMFGGTGVFVDGAMYAIINNGRIFLRGGETLDDELIGLNCGRFKHVKRSTTAIVNYYDITTIYLDNEPKCRDLVNKSIQYACAERNIKFSEDSRRLRDLPNMRLTLERMVKKAGIPDVKSFMSLGAVEVYRKVRRSHGSGVDVKLLWIFAGAVDGCHWTLLKDEQKSVLLKALNN
ncbi:TfoX/Sxy family DNA transformation protein [Photobacterium damselae]|nr:TfoX/Sxy family DNA transformation protein [Photobacterium damselae]TLS65579.1 TfoX/Sxy family DNA transformation protein [Photobacterium damselae subsp. damselae]